MNKSKPNTGMFSSVFHLETLVPRVKSRQTQSIQKSTIDLDFGRQSHQSRRSSFLPDTWDQDFPEDKYRSLGTSAYNIKDVGGERIIKEFCTGSKYRGEYNKLGLSGKGIYKFPHGVIYDGFFNKKGDFHGTGILIYPGGQKVEGIWRNGKLVKGANCVTADDIPFANHYCKMPDRRFQIEIQTDLSPAGQEYLTNAPNPPREILSNCYDAGQGFYDPKKRVIYDYDNPKSAKPLGDFTNADQNQQELYRQILSETASNEYILKKMRQQRINRVPAISSIPIDLLEKWIVRNCRKAWTEPVGYRSDLYETWTSGKKDEDLAKMTDVLDSKLGEDKIINELAKVSFNMNSNNASALISFIMTADDQKCKKEKSGSLMALSKMLLPGAEGHSGTHTEKKPHVHHSKKRASPKSRRSAKNKHEDAKEFVLKLKKKIMEYGMNEII